MGEATILGVLRENGYGIRPMAAATPDLPAAVLVPVKPFQWVGRQTCHNHESRFCSQRRNPGRASRVRSATGSIGLSEKQYQESASLARDCWFFSIERPGPRSRVSPPLGKAA